MCTDGLANKGLGSLDGKQPYHIVGNLEKWLSVGVSDLNAKHYRH